MDEPHQPAALDRPRTVGPRPVALPTPMPSAEADERGGEISLSRGFTDLAERAVVRTPGSCAAAVTLTDAAGGTLGDCPEGSAAAVTHPDLSELVAVQWESGEGPVPEALRGGEAVSVGEVLRETRWPRYRALALQRGLRASVTLPYRHDGAVLTLSLYAFRPGALGAVVEERGAELAGLVAGVLGRDRRYREALAEVEQLNSALRSRPVVDQACGIVVGREGCSAQEAFDLLRELSQRTNRKLSDLAEAIVRNRGRGLDAQLRKLRRVR
ncbi:GAF and ANTAR domain-containing protein [Streptomyces nanshensis]|nr:GAF and ANTAR domain-containing protein [Streptomyces nanshensis]